MIDQKFLGLSLKMFAEPFVEKNNNDQWQWGLTCRLFSSSDDESNGEETVHGYIGTPVGYGPFPAQFVWKKYTVEEFDVDDL